jgi:hypothetical protein
MASRRKDEDARQQQRVKGLLRRYEYGERDFRTIDLSQADLTGITLAGADLSRALLVGANLSGAIFDGCNLSGADLSGAVQTALERPLPQVSMREANLEDTVLSSTNLMGADLTGAAFRRAFFEAASLQYADLKGADFEESALYGVNLSFAKANATRLSGARCNQTIFAAVDLRGFVGLDSIDHRGPSAVDIDTLYRSNGEISETFLRGCGAPDDFIAYVRSLVAKPFDFYSCFISYSSKDHEFAERLYADLQHRGVRCWFAPEDLKIGDKFRHRIDDTIRTYDKLLIILSEHSIGSSWVESEVEAAFEQEDRRKKAVLFPIRLDGHAMTCDVGWAASMRRTRHNGDFSGWRQHDSYKKSFDRLMRDLKSPDRTP